ncbi:MAG: restriction endonuclease subunit S [Candidatus Cloacimonetes bacterium]|nr:restriction endonuclease subunit S [Candidatus Cloacimonadota bacterium]
MDNISPKGWLNCKLGDVLFIRNGYAFKSKDFQKEGIPLIKQTNLQNTEVDISKCVYLTKNYLKQYDNFIVNKGDLLISLSGSLGYISEYNEKYPALQNQRTGLITIFGVDLISMAFIKYYFAIIPSLILAQGKGIGVQNISSKAIEKMPFLLPPLTEQKRIAAKLDAVLPRVEKLKERLQNVQELIKQFRQSVLNAAVTGKLTEEWREENPSVESAEILLQQIMKFRLKNVISKRELNFIKKNYKTGSERLKNKISKYKLPKSWCFCEINNIGNVYNGSTPSRKSKEYWNGNINWVSSGEVANSIIAKTRETITKIGFENSSVKLFPKGTVLIAMIGEGKTRGQAAILNIESTCNQNVAAVILNHGFVLSRYLFYWFFMQYEHNRRLGSGSGPKALNCQRVRELDFILPPLAEQKEIIRQVDAFFAVAEKLEKRLIPITTRVEQLGQSVLTKAFRGELVITETELAEKENRSYETAEELLVRIKAEKQKLEAERKKGKYRK